MLQKIRFFDKKDPKLSLSELLSWMTRIQIYSYSKSAFFHALTLSLLPKNHMLFIVSKQCACSRRVDIEGHMLQHPGYWHKNRFGLAHVSA
jgi:hypothetical protein